MRVRIASLSTRRGRARDVTVVRGVFGRGEAVGWLVGMDGWRV